MRPFPKKSPNALGFKGEATPPSGGSGTAETIFSYRVKSKVPQLKVVQQETDFSLEIEMEILEDVLRVARFNLITYSHLQALSETLEDAATLEILLQSLKGVFNYADRYGLSEVFFILPQKEAIKISFFKNLFQEVLPIKWSDEKRVSLSLACAFQDHFLEEIAGIKAKVHQTLWAEQRHDTALRQFLQNRHKKDFSLLQTLLTPSQSVDDGKIIPFPCVRTKG